MTYLAELHLLRTMWFRNTWGWGAQQRADRACGNRRTGHGTAVYAEHPTPGRYRLDCEGGPDLLFTENETNLGAVVTSPIHSRTSSGISTRLWCMVATGEVNAEGEGTARVLVHYRLTVAPGQQHPQASPDLRHAAQSQEPWPACRCLVQI